MSDQEVAAGRQDPRRPHQRPRFAPTEHLASEAVAAYVDGELSATAYLRAGSHLSQCPECTAEVECQRQARVALREAADDSIAAPLELHDTLSRIPFAELSPTVAGRAVGSLSTDPWRFTSPAQWALGTAGGRLTGWWRK